MSYRARDGRVYPYKETRSQYNERKYGIRYSTSGKISTGSNGDWIPLIFYLIFWGVMIYFAIQVFSFLISCLPFIFIILVIATAFGAR